MNVNGYPAEMRLKAIKLYLKGNSFRNIEHLLKISHQSVANWSKLLQSNYQKLNFLKAPSGRTGQVLYLYWQEKNEIDVITVVNRASRRILSWDVVKE